MNILVTGATGFVGKHLIGQLQKGNNVHLLVRPESNYAALGIKQIFIFKDNIEELASYLETEHIDGVIHLASLYVAEHRSEQIKDLILSNIYLGTAILEACAKADVKWFLNTGTIWQNFNVPDKSDEYNPVNLYAATKQAFITMAKYYTETSNLRFCTLKLCDTYGPNDTRRKILSLFDELAKTGQTLDMSPGEQKLDLLHIEDVVNGFIVLANMLNDISIHLDDEYVLTSGRSLTLIEIAKLYEKTHNVKLSINWGGRPYRKREVMRPYQGKKLPNWNVTIPLFK